MRTVPEPRAARELAETLEWAQHHLDRPLTVDGLAARALMSPRTFARRFRQQTGTTPRRRRHFSTPAASRPRTTAARSGARPALTIARRSGAMPGLRGGVFQDRAGSWLSP
jgi:AraC-like DNA-binding protein